MSSAKLSERIMDCLGCDHDREKEEAVLYSELSQISSHVVRAVIVNLCEEIEKLKMS